ncbi:MAG TPA: PAC2 family protein [Candidatus Norongarragalinales archaeon]|jgi:uncharacterized protein|nr:PAC2 family protein [Candidatus Norongarragalinales archaeon]
MAQIEIREIEKIKLKDPIIIEGFPGIGMIGTIAANYLAEKLEMQLVGYIASPQFPPIAAIHDFRPVSPARIYASEKYNIIALFSELVIPAEIVFDLSNKIIDWAQSKGAVAIYSLAGIATENPEDKIYAITSTKEMTEKLSRLKIELVREGATQGVSGVLIAECAARKFPAANLMIQTNTPLDPKGAAALIDKLAPIIGIKIDTAPLVAEGEKVQARMKEAMQRIQAVGKNYQDLETQKPYG